MRDETGADPPSHRTQVEATGGRTAVHGGSGNQYVEFGGVWARMAVLVVGVSGASAGIVMAPEASEAQYVFYCVLLILCVTTSVVCLWFACDGGRKKLVAFVGLVAFAVASASVAAGSYKLLADHGDVEARVTLRNDEPMGDRGEVTMDVDADSSRSRLRIKILIEDKYSYDQCDTFSKVSVMPMVDGKTLRDEAVLLADGGVGDFNLHGARERATLRAVVDTTQAGDNCQLNLRFDSAVLYDDEWWLL